jgi:pimeloyl-ACP methyl ester carboxylesterase
MVANMGTLNFARDFEILRRALGEGAINYFGVSYGSEVGIAYAIKFPQNIRAMIIDGIFDRSPQGYRGKSLRNRQTVELPA